MTNKHLLLCLCLLIIISDYFGFEKLILKCIPFPEHPHSAHYSKFNLFEV